MGAKPQGSGIESDRQATAGSLLLLIFFEITARARLCNHGQKTSAPRACFRQRALRVSRRPPDREHGRQLFHLWKRVVSAASCPALTARTYAISCARSS